MFHVDQRPGGRLLRWALVRAVLGAALLGGVLLAVATPPVDTPALVEASDTDPLPPTNVVITPGNGQFTTVTWTASTEPNRSGYVVKVGSYQTTVTGTTTTTPITGLTNGTDYTVQVFTRTSYNLLGLQTATGTVPATASSYPRDGVAPAAPTGVAAVRGDGQVTVTWAANTEPDLAGYQVLRDGTPVSGTLTGRTFTDTGLVNDTTYRYRVQAVDVSRQWSQLVGTAGGGDAHRPHPARHADDAAHRARRRPGDRVVGGQPRDRRDLLPAAARRRRGGHHPGRHPRLHRHRPGQRPAPTATRSSRWTGTTTGRSRPPRSTPRPPT
jgi:chitodextrinase